MVHCITQLNWKKQKQNLIVNSSLASNICCTRDKYYLNTCIIKRLPFLHEMLANKCSSCQKRYFVNPPAAGKGYTSVKGTCSSMHVLLVYMYLQYMYTVPIKRNLTGYAFVNGNKTPSVKHSLLHFF